MKDEDQIINKVASSSLLTFNLEEYYQAGERVALDIKDQLYEGLLLREKDFRSFIKNHDWAQYKNKFVAIMCSTEAIVPTWAYMLVAIELEGYAKRAIFGSLQELETAIFRDALSRVQWSGFQDAKVVIKGCSKVDVPVAVYVDVVSHLKPHARSLMFGEPCSTVPLFKKAKIFS